MKMSPRKRQNLFSRKVVPGGLTTFGWKTTKRNAQPAEAGKAGGVPSDPHRDPQAAALPATLPCADPAPSHSKREASTSAPSTPARLKKQRPHYLSNNVTPESKSTGQVQRPSPAPLFALPRPSPPASIPGSAVRSFPATPPSLTGQPTPVDEDISTLVDGASDRSASISSSSTANLAPNQSIARAGVGTGTQRRDFRDKDRVLRTIKAIKEFKYVVTKGGRRGKYLVQRTLRHRGFGLLLEELEKEENKTLKDYFDHDLQ